MGTAGLTNLLLEKEILLESGTNELEVLVFRLGECTMGINVAKVREVLPAGEITALPKANPSIRGVFKLRDAVIPCVSLLAHLGLESTASDPEGTMILADFNGQQTAFLIDKVEKIHRVNWNNILAVPPVLAVAHTPITAVGRIDNRLIIMLDFETIIDQVTDHIHRAAPVENTLGLPRGELRILLADDSPTVRQTMTETLRASGYTNLQIFQNGREAWDWIESRFAETGSVDHVGDLLISDVEMPLIDGFHLTKRIKQHPQLATLPVLLYSSIVTPDNLKKGMAVGADRQVSKPELGKVVEVADELIGNRRNLQGIPAPTPAPTPVSTVPNPATHAAPPQPIAGNSTWHDLADRLLSSPVWSTFRGELGRHVDSLESWFLADEASTDPDQFREVARTLHTIKSAAMVVPVDPISQATHQIESLCEEIRKSGTFWPRETLATYIGALRQITGDATTLVAGLAELNTLAKSPPNVVVIPRRG